MEFIDKTNVLHPSTQTTPHLEKFQKHLALQNYLSHLGQDFKDKNQEENHGKVVAKLLETAITNLHPDHLKEEPLDKEEMVDHQQEVTNQPLLLQLNQKN